MAKTPSTPVSPAALPEPTPAGKGHATPTRKEREAALRRPLVPKDRKLASQQNRATIASEREKARVGMARGDERYLPVRDKGVQKRYVRDFVDARFSAGEILMPTLVLVILTWFVPQIADYAFLGFWAIFLFVVADCVVLGFQVTRRLAAKYGKDKVERVRWYAAMRAIQMRFLRLPKPQVKRGEYPA
ncbi:DUF3043 domain-containing protein [Pseudolysinimonas sp.]|uniref:DUF3043 domain-containing protein n=1 Tax=Pseudolysinimonas sp. TaxID=2680009 RepID=UPI00286A504D|nr:DUF3043 domain-containing protein [Pseudolysinimonas sp.]